MVPIPLRGYKVFVEHFFKASSTRTVNITVQCRPMVLSTHKVKKKKGAAHKTAMLTLCVNEA